MKVYIFTAALLLSFATFTTSKAEADFNPPPITADTFDAFRQGIRTGTFSWATPHEESQEQHQAYNPNYGL